MLLDPIAFLGLTRDHESTSIQVGQHPDANIQALKRALHHIGADRNRYAVSTPHTLEECENHIPMLYSHDEDQSVWLCTS